MGTTNISGHAIENMDSEVKVYYCEKKKKEVLYFLCGFISTCNEGMSRWVLTGCLKLTSCPVDRPEL